MKEKVRKEDISVKELPHTRWQVFFDLLKHQKRQMFSLSLLFFVFCLPLVVDVLLFNQFIVAAGATIEDPQELASSVFGLILLMAIIAIPCAIIMFVGLGGLAHVSKLIAWQEGGLFGPSFFEGIKKNWKHSLFLGIIWSLSLFLLVAGSFFLLRTMGASEFPWVHSIGIGLCITQFIVLSIVCIYGLTITVYYQLPFKAVLKNAFIFFTAKFFKNLALFIFTTGLVVGLMFIGFISQIVSVIVVIVFSSLMAIGWTLLSHQAFDQYINQYNYPEYMNKGLYLNKLPKEE